ncbi:MAG: GAF domain-containing protein [Deltaproteobacteria bacterium]|nr:GAF domain-containing protein [Deltaproteobacteria bacterium]
MTVCNGQRDSFVLQMLSVLTDQKHRLEDRLQKSIGILLASVQARAGSIMLAEGRDKTLKIMAATNERIRGKVLPIDPHSVSGYVSVHLEPLLVEDINQDLRFGRRGGSYQTDSLLCVPLLSEHGNGLLGVVNASDREDDESFTVGDLDLMVGYARIVAPMVENVCLLERVRQEKELYERTARELEIKQRELELTGRERDELVQMVVHDFKSPLSAVISNLDLLLYMGLEGEQEAIAGTALKGASSLLQMINDFLDIARIDHWRERSGKLVPVDLQAAAQEVADELRPMSEAKGQVMIVPDSEAVMVMADGDLLRHLLQNLFSNAVKYTPEGGRIAMGWSTWESRRKQDPYGKVVKFWVEDDGPGVADDLKEAVFEKFLRTREARDSNVQGTGIGLFFCRKIATLLQGRIWVEDAEPHGSRFCVILFRSEDE